MRRVHDQLFSPVDLVGIAERARELSTTERSLRREKELAQLGV
jgi:hypothetical protein